MGTSAAGPGEFRDRMIAWLADRKWRQEDLAKKAGLSVGTINNLYRGAVRKPHPETIGKIAKALGLTPAQVLHDLPSSAGLTSEQQELLRLYAQTTKAHRKLVLALLRERTQRPKGSK